MEDEIKRRIEFHGVEVGGFGVEIPEGSHVACPEGDFVEMAHGQKYKVRLINLNKFKCECNVKIDGLSQGKTKDYIY